jgi:hypothetical protein
VDPMSGDVELMVHVPQLPAAAGTAATATRAAPSWCISVTRVTVFGRPIAAGFPELPALVSLLPPPIALCAPLTAARGSAFMHGVTPCCASDGRIYCPVPLLVIRVSDAAGAAMEPIDPKALGLSSFVCAAAEIFFASGATGAVEAEEGDEKGAENGSWEGRGRGGEIGTPMLAFSDMKAGRVVCLDAASRAIRWQAGGESPDGACRCGGGRVEPSRAASAACTPAGKGFRPHPLTPVAPPPPPPAASLRSPSTAFWRLRR